MKIGIAKESKDGDKRVILLPNEVSKLVESGHEVFVEKNAGINIHVYDKDYESVGAKIWGSKKDLFSELEMLVKLKAPSNEEFALLNNNILFSMIHHSQNMDFVYRLGERGALGIEMESIFNDAGERLIDATDITGEIGVLYASQHLQKIPQECSALILGYGRVGSGAINMCNKLGIKTKILRKDEYRNIDYFMRGKDLLVNAISWPAEDRENRRYVVKRDAVNLLNRNAVVLDLSVDYPNPIETCRPTSLNNPYYIEEGRVHVGIYGYPGLVPISSSKRYSEQILPLVLEVANNGGLNNLEKRSEIGRYISNSIVDPVKLGWEQYKPRDLNGSFIE